MTPFKDVMDRVAAGERLFARRDASWSVSGRGGNAAQWHAWGAKGVSACNENMLLDEYSVVPATHVPNGCICRRPGCWKAFVAEVGVEKARATAGKATKR